MTSHSQSCSSAAATRNTRHSRNARLRADEMSRSTLRSTSEIQEQDISTETRFQSTLASRRFTRRMETTRRRGGGNAWPSTRVVRETLLWRHKIHLLDSFTWHYLFAENSFDECQSHSERCSNEKLMTMWMQIETQNGSRSQLMTSYVHTRSSASSASLYTLDHACHRSDVTRSQTVTFQRLSTSTSHRADFIRHGTSFSSRPR